MVDSFAVGKTQAVEPSFGSYVDTWQLPVNANFGTFDAAVSGTTTIDVTGVTASNPYVNVTFSEFNATTNPTPWTQPNAGQNLRVNLIGSLTFNITVLIQPIAGFWIFSNNTVGAFSIIVSTSAGGGSTVTIPAACNSIVFSDGTNVVWADNGNVVANVPQAIPSGAIMPFGMITAPTGWLICNGAAVLRTTYSALFAAIGTAWGTGDGSTTFNIPNFQGTFLRGWNSTTSGYDANRQFASYQADTYLNHTHTDAGHTHTIPGYPGSAPQSAIPGSPNWYINGGPTTTSTGYADIQNSTTGGTETTPKNYAVQYCIKT